MLIEHRTDMLMLSIKYKLNPYPLSTESNNNNNNKFVL